MTFGYRDTLSVPTPIARREALLSDQFSSLCRYQRLRKEVALSEFAPKRSPEFELGSLLNALRNHLLFEFYCQGKNQVHHVSTCAIGWRSGSFAGSSLNGSSFGGVSRRSRTICDGRIFQEGDQT